METAAVDTESGSQVQDTTPSSSSPPPPATAEVATAMAPTVSVLQKPSPPPGSNEFLFEIEYRLQALAALASAIGGDVAKAVIRTLFHGGQ